MNSWLPREAVVVPLDFSDDSMAAVDTALDMVVDASHLHFVHVLPILEPTEPGMIWETVDNTRRADHVKEAIKKELAARKCMDAEIVVLFGDPGHEIVRYAEEIDAGLIAVASHGRTGLAHLLIGSTAERVVRLAHCPVLVLKH